EIHTGAHQDLKVVSQIARSMVTEYGMSDSLGPITYGKKSQQVFLGKDLGEERNYSEAIAEQIDQAVREIADECYAKAKELLSGHREELDLLVEMLLEHESLERADVEALLEHGVMAADLEQQEGEEEVSDRDEESGEAAEGAPEAAGKPERGTIPPGLPEPETP
ncbi:MAG: cell division protein FtsH, partial [Armatimonadota bacterium]